MTSKFKMIRPILVFIYFDFPLALNNVERAFTWIVKFTSGSKPYACFDVSVPKLALPVVSSRIVTHKGGSSKALNCHNMFGSP